MLQGLLLQQSGYLYFTGGVGLLDGITEDL